MWLRRIFGPERDEVTVKWRKIRNEELNDCTTHQILSDNIEKTEMGGACSTHDREERCTQCFGRETSEKRQL
jgi:hypothetical protein